MKKNRKNFSLIKLLFIFIIVGFVAVPKSFGQVTAKNEASAIETLRSLAIAEGVYRARTGSFANIPRLVRAGLFDESSDCGSSSSCLKDGYYFYFTPSTIRPNNYFNLVAVPQIIGSSAATGSRSFYVDERGIIYHASGGTAPASVDNETRTVFGGLRFLNLFPGKTDRNADGLGDIAVFRSSNGIWFLQTTSTYYSFIENFLRAIQFGSGNDKIVPADYDGDGRTDTAVYRDGVWFCSNCALVSGYNYAYYSYQFGEPTDIPVPADYDGDVKADVAVFRPSTGVWYVQGSRAGFFTVQFGQEGDKPVIGDFDGDGTADFAVFRLSEGVWYIQQSSAGFKSEQFGVADDKLVAADYDGDGKTDIAVYRPSEAAWYLNQSSVGMKGFKFGIPTDVPAPADYNGDGKADIAVFRDGMWYISESETGQFRTVEFGSTGDQPVTAAYVR